MNDADPSSSGTSLAIVVARDGRLPVGADEAAAEAGGRALVVGSGSEAAGRALDGASHVWWLETGDGFRPAELAATVAPMLASVALTVLPASPDGRDLAPRLAAACRRPLVAGAVRASVRPPDAPGELPTVEAEVSRLDGRVLVPVVVEGPAIATLLPGSRAVPPREGHPHLEAAAVGRDAPSAVGPDPELVALVPPDPRTMDLAEAGRVVAGGAGLAAGLDDAAATEAFGVLETLAAAIGASAGATRVATDAGWTGYERQIGTTGVTVDPELYLAFGISGATQHLGGIGTPRTVVSVNTDPSCPMTAMADLGLVADARSLLVELAKRFAVDAASAAAPATRTTGAGGA